MRTSRPMSTFDPKEYWEIRLRQHWDLEGVGLVGYGLSYNRWLYRVRRRVFLSHVRALPLDFPRCRILDVGSGTGFYVRLWKSLGVQSVTASDVASIAVERLKRAYPDVPCVQLDISGSLDAQGFKGRFDVISAFDVLFHIVDDDRFRAAISNLSSLCKSGGYLIFSDNFPHGKTVRASHQVSRSLEEITCLLAEAEFVLVKRAPMFFLMNAPVDTKSSWPLLLWRSVMLPVRLVHPLGALWGALLFPVELCLTGFLKESPTTELMICQRR
jgi:2-polyprenyl-3-methyl-5-hydroxy-6-metoxy-1,4-benzoquinol methylase